MDEDTVDTVEVDNVDEVRTILEKCGYGLKFTFEKPKEGKLQFQDLLISLNNSHNCWSYSPCSRKVSYIIPQLTRKL